MRTNASDKCATPNLSAISSKPTTWKRFSAHLQVHRCLQTIHARSTFHFSQTVIDPKRIYLCHFKREANNHFGGRQEWKILQTVELLKGGKRLCCRVQAALLSDWNLFHKLRRGRDEILCHFWVYVLLGTKKTSTKETISNNLNADPRFLMDLREAVCPWRHNTTASSHADPLNARVNDHRISCRLAVHLSH